MAFNNTTSMTVSQQITFGCTCLDVTGMSMSPPSTPSWSNSDNTAVTISPSGNNLTCSITAVAQGFSDVTLTVGSMSWTTRVVVNGPILNVVRIDQQ